MPVQSMSEMIFSKHWNEYRINLYQLKLLGFMWFSGNLPEKFNKDFELHFNMYRSEEEPPRGAEEIDKLGEGALEYLCSIMFTPDWVNNDQRDHVFRLGEVDDFSSGALFIAH